MTESDFPNIFDDLAIFDEMDKQKLSKKQKKKLKKKKKTNKTSETAEKTSEPEIILLTKEKSSDKYEQFSEISKEIIEPALENNNEKSQEIIAIIVDKTNIINENIKIEEKIEKILEPLAVVEKEFEIEKPIEIFKKPLEVVEKFIEEKGEFIEVTKKIPKNVNINNKRFATFCTKPEPTSYRSTMKNTYLEKKEINEDRFKIEKDSRKKPLETKTFQKSVPIYLKSKAVNLINTTEIELASDKNKTNYKESEEKDFQIKTEHGVTLCKKKHAKEVLMAKIKRKEVERYKITPKSSENNFNSNSSEKIDVIVNDKIIFEKKEIFITKEIQDFSFKKDCKSLSQKIFWKKMENDLNKFTDNIANECQRMKVYRVCVFDRIEFIVSNLFATFNAHIKMYGSCVTGTFFFNEFMYFFKKIIGLELPYSDLDIGVSGFEKISKFETENILSLLLENLSYMKWVKLCKPIFTANVPLLKLVNN